MWIFTTLPLTDIISRNTGSSVLSCFLEDPTVLNPLFCSVLVYIVDRNPTYLTYHSFVLQNYGRPPIVYSDTRVLLFLDLVCIYWLYLIKCPDVRSLLYLVLPRRVTVSRYHSFISTEQGLYPDFKLKGDPRVRLVNCIFGRGQTTMRVIGLSSFLRTRPLFVVVWSDVS